MTNVFNDFYEAWNWLYHHPYYYSNEDNEWFLQMKLEPLNNSMFLQGLDVQVVKVNPQTMHIDDNDSNNTLTQVCLESSTDVYDDNLEQWLYTHDWDSDCGADTYEEAILGRIGQVGP